MQVSRLIGHLMSAFCFNTAVDEDGKCWRDCQMFGIQFEFHKCPCPSMHSFQQIDHQLQLDGQFIRRTQKHTNLQVRLVQNTKRLSRFNNVLTLFIVNQSLKLQRHVCKRCPPTTKKQSVVLTLYN